MLKLILSLFLALAALGPLAALAIDADDPLIQYFGRFDFSNPKEARFDWPGVYIQVRFTGTSVGIRMADDNDRYNITIDGKAYPTLETKGAAPAVYPLADGLSPGEHTLLLARRHEQSAEVPAFLGLVLDEGARLVPLPPKPTLKMEFIGDSFVVGYGCEFNHREGGYPEYLRYTNTSLAFGPLGARHFGAQYLVSAYSGLGLLRNSDGSNPGKTFTTYYPYTLHTLVNTGGTPAPWDFSSWQPQVVVINLGINDFSGTAAAPSPHKKWKEAFHRYLADLRGWYPQAKFILCATPIWPGFEFQPLTEEVVNEEHAAGHTGVYYFDYTPASTALNWHPCLEDHKDIAQGLEDLISQEKLLQP